MNLTQPALVGSTGATDIFLLRYDYEGTAMSGWRYGGSNTEFMWDLQTDAFGGVYLAALCTTAGGMSLGPTMNITQSQFVARLMTVRAAAAHI